MFNKIAGAVLGTLLVLVALRIVAEGLFGPDEPVHEEATVEHGGGVEGDATAVANAGDPAFFLLLTQVADDAAGNEAAAAQCSGCHNFAEGGPNMFGPNLYGVVGRVIGSHEGFTYSPALTAAKDAGDTWTLAGLDAFIKSPQTAHPGTTMPFGGIADDTDRAHVVAFLRSLSATPVAIEIPAGAEATAPAAAADLGPVIAAADPAAGEMVAAQCAGCHSLVAGGPNMFGPNLYGVIARPVGSHEGFSYSPALTAAHAAGETWTLENIDAFLHNPQESHPGTTMPFGGIADDTDRHNLVAYLRTLSDNPVPLPEAAAAPAPAAEPAPAPAAEPAPAAPAAEPAAPAAEPAAAAADLVPVTFTAEQATAGAEAYATDCAGCHGADLVTGFAPHLAGDAFAHWFTGPVSALWEKVTTQMPMGAPGTLDPETYANIIAYILQENGFTAGTEPLPTDAAVLATMGFIKTEGAAPAAEPAPAAPAAEPAPAAAPAAEPAPAPAAEPAPAPAAEPAPAPAAEPAPAPAAEPAPAPAAEPAPAPAAEPAPAPAAEPAPAPAAAPAAEPAPAAAAAPAAETPAITLAFEDIANPTLLAAVAAGDVAAGEQAAMQCAGCHSFGEGEANRFGPNLYGIVYRIVGSHEGFSYSPALAALEDQGAVWTYAGLDAFLTNPQAAIPGTAMPFAGIADAAERANLIAYLRTLAAEPVPVAYTAP